MLMHQAVIFPHLRPPSSSSRSRARVPVCDERLVLFPLGSPVPSHLPEPVKSDIEHQLELTSRFGETESNRFLMLM